MGKTNEMEKKPTFMQSITNEIKTHRATFLVYLILRLLVIGFMVLSAIRGNWENLFGCTLALILFLVPPFIEKQFGLELPSALEIIVFLFIFSAIILGEISCYYIKYPYWDAILHTTNGFVCAAVGFSLIDMINRNPKIKFQLAPIFLVIVAFCFSMTIGVLWEFYEFGMDKFFDKDMQKDTVVHTISSVKLDETNTNTPVVIKNIDSVAVNGEDLNLGGYLDIGLYDTMKDLFVNFIGAVVFSCIGYFYVKGRGKGKFAKEFIPILKEEYEEQQKENEAKGIENKFDVGFDAIVNKFEKEKTAVENKVEKKLRKKSDNIK